ncbi:MAG: alpha/beta hydrolase [Verrucomicrobiota bacterium]
MFLILLSLYVVLCAVGCALQRRLIYFPAKFDSKLAETMAVRAGFTPWKNPSGQIIGWKSSADSPATASVLIVHGNGGCAIDRGYFSKPIHAAVSVDVYVLEYPGYGARKGSPGQTAFYAAADEAFDLLDKTLPVYIVSESLGTGVAAHLAKTHRNVSGMVMFAPYDNFCALAQSKMPILPVRLILLDRFDPAGDLENYHGAIQFILAEKDVVIPRRFGQRLAESFQGKKRVEIISGAGHNEVQAQSPEWWKETFSFLAQKEIPQQ